MTYINTRQICKYINIVGYNNTTYNLYKYIILVETIWGLVSFIHCIDLYLDIVENASCPMWQTVNARHPLLPSVAPAPVRRPLLQSAASDVEGCIRGSARCEHF